MVYPLITLYPSTETKFETNGLGSLSEATRCKVVEEGNGSFELELDYPIFGRRYKDLQIRTIIFAKPNPIDPPQAFRIYKISKPMGDIVTYYAAHISYDLSGYPIEPFTASTCAAAMAGLKTHSLVEHPFEFYTDKNTNGNFGVDFPIEIRTVLGGVEGSILDVYHGEYKFDNFTVNLYNHRGMDRGVVIRYGKNLTDLNQEENNSKVYTAVLPYWQNYDDGSLVQLPEKYVKTEGTYNFTNILVMDFTSDFEEKPTEDQLRQKTQSYIQNNDIGKPDVSIDVSFVQLEQTKEYEHLALLERVELFDTVTVEFPEMEVSATAKVCKTEYDVLTGRYDSVTLGSIRSNISSTIVEQEGTITQVVEDTKGDLEKAVNDATKWITNGRGYMVAVKNENNEWMELCSLDTKDIHTAVNVWRWNNGGFGHSSHGYNGPYDTAITQDGKINANFITTGTLSANIIKSGSLLIGGSGSQNVTISVLDANSKEIGRWDKNGIVASGSITAVSGKIGSWKIDSKALYKGNISDQYSSDTYYGHNGTGVMYLGDKGISISDKFQVDSSGNLSSKDGIIYAQKLVSTEVNGAYRSLEISNGVIDFAPGSSYHTCRISGISSALTFATDGEFNFSSINQSDGTSRLLTIISRDRFHIQGVSVTVTDNFTVNGTKKRAVKTEEYGTRVQYCYEMASPMFGDIGEGITDENGECYVGVDDIFSKTISDSMEYQVFLQKEFEGDIWISEKNPNYFVVKGKPNSKFAWEIKARQRDYEFERLEFDDEYVKQYLDDYEIPPYSMEYDDEIDKMIKEQEALYDETT